jgi:hypothetical protein
MIGILTHEEMFLNFKHLKDSKTVFCKCNIQYFIDVFITFVMFIYIST